MMCDLVNDTFKNILITDQSPLFIGDICFHSTEGAEVQQEEPPIKEPTRQNTDSSSQSQPTDKTASTGTSVIGTVSAIETTFLRV